MGLNIKLFVHGVPMGQKIWGPQGDDNRYLASFYGPKWEVPEVMIVEAMSFGNTNYCYYSFVKGQNVYDSQGRAGSYFALTLRINAFYSDIQNVYNILKATYGKMCVGLCIDETNDKTKFLLADFQNVDSKFKEIENHILNYISEFSIDSDIVPLNGFALNGKGAVFNLNMHECSSSVAIDILKKNGKLMVSPFFLSSSASKKVAQYQEEMQRNAQKAQEEIRLQKQASQQKIDELILQSKEDYDSLKKQSDNELRLQKEQCHQQLSQLKNENDRRLEEMRHRYTKVDSELTNLNRIIKEQEKEITNWANRCKRKDQEIEQSNRKVNNLVQQIYSLQRGGDSHERFGNSWVRNKKAIIGIFSFFILLLFVFFICWFTARKFKDQTNKIQKQKEQIGQLIIMNGRLQKEKDRLKYINDSLIFCSRPKTDSVLIKQRN